MPTGYIAPSHFNVVHDFFSYHKTYIKNNLLDFGVVEAQLTANMPLLKSYLLDSFL